MRTKLFDSITKPVPEIRRDLEIMSYQKNGDSYLIFHDSRGYIPTGFGLQRQVKTLLSLLDGRKSIQDLEAYLGAGTSKEELLQFIQLLDENQLLNSTHFKDLAEATERQYEQSTVHQPETAGGSYPKDPQKLRQHLNTVFAQTNGANTGTSKNIKALYAPHIDPRVGLSSYAKAFTALKGLTPKRVVMLATSHYAGLYPNTYQGKPFILVNKDFDMPLATVKRDEKAINQLLEQQQDTELGITGQDRAHRMEHSIELHLLFLSYLWQHDYKIIPFLVHGLDDLYFMKDGYLGKQLSNFADLLKQQFGQNNDTFFLISGDLAHFGKKFGDQHKASTMFDEVRSFDEKFLDYAIANERGKMLELMTQNMDPYRICGFPPLYTFLQAMPELKGKRLSYDIWDESDRESAVSYGSIVYREQMAGKG